MSSYYNNGGLAQQQSAQYTGAPWGPADAGYLAWSGDPEYAVAGQTMVTGKIEIHRIRLGVAATITGIVINVQSAGSTLTANQNLLGLYNTSGTQLGITGDQAAVWTSTGNKQAALTASYAAQPGDYFVAVMSNGTSPAAFTRYQTLSTPNGLLTTPLSGLRSLRTSGSANTALPTPMNIPGTMAAQGAHLWVALY